MYRRDAYNLGLIQKFAKLDCVQALVNHISRTHSVLSYYLVANACSQNASGPSSLAWRLSMSSRNST